MNLAIFVNSSDGFEDCWIPFFNLFTQYAGELKGASIYLNTERKSYQHEGMSILSTRVWSEEEHKRLCWSECLIRGLRQVRERYVLYLQEDYFLNRPINEAIISETVHILQQDSGVAAVYLNKHGPQFKHTEFYGPNFVEIRSPVSYLLSTQAAVWNRDILISLIRPWENGWMFEKFGSGRALKSKLKFISVDQKIMHEQPVINYIATGVIKGKWKKDCISLFESHGIEMDFYKRGFYRDHGRFKSRVEVAKKILINPVDTLRSLASLI